MKILNTKAGLIVMTCLLVVIGYLLLPVLVSTESVEITSSVEKKDMKVTPNVRDTNSVKITSSQLLQKQHQRQNASPHDSKTCRSHYLPNKNLAQWRQRKQIFITSFFENLQHSGIDQVLLEKVAIESGVGLFLGRKLLSGYQGDVRKPPYAEKDARLASFDETLLVNQRLESNDLAGLATDIMNKKISPNAYYPSPKGLVFLLSYVLQSSVDNKANVIEELVDSGIKVFYADLVTVTQLNMPQAVIDKLFKASDLQASHVLKRFGRYTSLALLAIEAKSAGLASYWITMGSPIKPDLFFDNAMDVLAKEGATMTSAEIDGLFEQMADQGLTPY